MSKWNDGVNEYVDELREQLAENGLEPTLENMLNGAEDWEQYSYGGCSLIYDKDIAERLATPSEIKSRTSKRDGGLSNMANAREMWLDVQARALYQASIKVMEDQK